MSQVMKNILKCLHTGESTLVLSYLTFSRSRLNYCVIWRSNVLLQRGDQNYFPELTDTIAM